MHKAWRGALFFFDITRQISRSHRPKKSTILTRIQRFWTVTPVLLLINWWLRNDAQRWKGYRRDVLLFLRPSVKFQGYTGKKNDDLTRIERFWTRTPVWIQDSYEMRHKPWTGMKDVAYSLSMSSVKFQGHTGQKNRRFWLKWEFPDCNSNLNL